MSKFIGSNYFLEILGYSELATSFAPVSCTNTIFVFCVLWRGKGWEALAQNESRAWDGSKEVTEQDALSARPGRS